jgi:hypothetical protein
MVKKEHTIAYMEAQERFQPSGINPYGIADMNCDSVGRCNRGIKSKHMLSARKEKKNHEKKSVL